MRRLTTSAALMLALSALGAAAAGPASAHDAPGAWWTVREAESVRTIRSMPVRVRECRGLGQPVTTQGRTRYRHFRCIAGTRAPWETYDTIAVLFVLHPLAPYRATARRFALTSVRFVGGPGIP